jgi:hypothetical protein
MRLKLYIVFWAVFIAGGGLSAQQFTMKGGLIYSKMAIPKNENPAGSVDPLLNYYYEANYSQRFGKRKYWTIGFGYLGAGGTIYGRNLALGGGVRYIVDTRFSNLIFPMKFKFSTEHRKHPRFYCFAGVAPAWMFDEAREMEVHYLDPVAYEKEKKLRKINPFDFHAQKLQGYVMTGCGVYYKHIVLDVSAMTNVFHVYKEFVAPVSINYGVVATLGVQVSRPLEKYSCHSFF